MIRKRRQRMQRKKENRQKIKEHWIPMILPLRMPHRKAKKQKKNRSNKKIREIFRMQEMGMILPAVLMKA